MNLRVFGPPGTGKTYFLTRTIYHLVGLEHNEPLFNEYGLSIPWKVATFRDISFISFTNSAVDELFSRIGRTKNYKVSPSGTMHGLGMHLLHRMGVLPTTVLAATQSVGVPIWQNRFLRKYGVPFDPSHEVKLAGDQFFDILSYAINVYYPKYQNLGAVLDIAVDMMYQNELESWTWLVDEWYKFKKENGIIDYNDVLVLLYKHEVQNPSRILVADEFQDFSPLQWEIFKQWMSGKSIVIIAGDDDQCIHSYSGASPVFMLKKFPADSTIVLKKSFRVPKEVHRVATYVVSNYVYHRYPKNFLPREYNGKVLVRRWDVRAMAVAVKKLLARGASVMVLARTNKQVRDIEEVFLQVGVPYRRLKSVRDTIWDVAERVNSFVSALRSGGTPQLQDAKLFFRLGGYSAHKVEANAKIVVSNPKNLLAQAIIQNPARFIKLGPLTDMFGEKRSRLAYSIILATLDGRMDVTSKAVIDTIHSAKGREADIVILYDSITRRIAEDIYESMSNFEDEVRVWYVGMTRARVGLVVVPGDDIFLTQKIGKIVAT